jgi:hypothetical protein
MGYDTVNGNSAGQPSANLIVHTHNKWGGIPFEFYMDIALRFGGVISQNMELYINLVSQ